MAQWEYEVVTLRLTQASETRPGYFRRNEQVHTVDADSLKAMAKMGEAGWELVNVILLDFGALSGGTSYASAFFKRKTSV